MFDLEAQQAQPVAQPPITDELTGTRQVPRSIGESKALPRRTQALAQASMKLGEAMYRQADSGGAGAGATGEAAGAGGSTGGQEGVVDVDFEEVDENKKGKSA